MTTLDIMRFPDDHEIFQSSGGCLITCAKLMTDIYQGSRSKTMTVESMNPDPITRNSTVSPIVSNPFIKAPDITIPQTSYGTQLFKSQDSTTNYKHTNIVPHPDKNDQPRSYPSSESIKCSPFPRVKNHGPKIPLSDEERERKSLRKQDQRFSLETML